jgi:hypothetical protein
MKLTFTALGLLLPFVSLTAADSVPNNDEVTPAPWQDQGSRYAMVQDATSVAKQVTNSPFAAKPCNSYSNYQNDKGQTVFPLWGSLKPLDFGSREVTFDQTGVRTLRQTPAPGVHPRIFFTPEDLPDVRRRLKETRCGQEVWKNILSWTEMLKGCYDDHADYAKPDLTLGGWQGLHARVPLSRLGAPLGSTVVNGSKWNKSDNAAALYKSLVDGSATNCPAYYWNAFSLEAFRSLVENDEKSAKDIAAAVCTALRIGQVQRDAKQAAAKAEAEAKHKVWVELPPDQPVGAFQLSFCYDFLFNWMTDAQKKALHDELALGTWSHDNYGTFNEATTSRSNWATFSYWLYEVLGIEGEEGFNELKVRGMYRGWRDLLTYGWFLSGATFEGEAKNQLGMDGVMLFAAREKKYGFTNLCGHPYLQAYARKFLPHSINAMLTGFHKYDLLGGSRSGSGGFTPCDMLGLKYMFPNDKVSDWVYRQSIGENYENVPTRPDGYFNALLFFASFCTDFDAGNVDVSKLALGNTFFCGERALMMTRSGWDTNAAQLNLHVRQANGGHPFADRNALMIAGAGRIWSPNGYANFKTPENSVVDIDGKTQTVNTPGRLLDFVDAPLATFAVGDAKYCWDWQWDRLEKRGGYYTKDDVDAKKVVVPPGSEPEMHSINDFSYTKLPYAYVKAPFFELPSWILPTGALTPIVRKPNYPVKTAFRTAGLVRGTHPYMLAMDDIRKDDARHHYDWVLSLEKDIQIASVKKNKDGTTDLLLTGADPNQSATAPKEGLPGSMTPGCAIPSNQPVLLVRVLEADGMGDPRIETLPNQTDAKRYAPVRRLVIPSESVAPGFKVLFFPHRQGESLPESAWNPTHTQLTVSWNGQTDTATLSVGRSGKTNLILQRAGIETSLVSVTKDADPISESH